MAFTVTLITNQVTIPKQQSITSNDICFRVCQKEEEQATIDTINLQIANYFLSEFEKLLAKTNAANLIKHSFKI